MNVRRTPVVTSELCGPAPATAAPFTYAERPEFVWLAVLGFLNDGKWSWQSRSSSPWTTICPYPAPSNATCGNTIAQTIAS